jgi:hypothetical protein
MVNLMFYVWAALYMGLQTPAGHLDLTCSTSDLSRRHSSAHIFSKSKVWMGKYLKKVAHVNHQDNVSSDPLSGLADVIESWVE